MKIRTKIRHFLTEHLVILILGFVALLCAIFIICGVQSENGSITLDGKEYTSVTTWGKTVTGLDIFTKVSGVNSLFLRARKDNDSSVTLSNRVCYCMVIN